MLQALTDFTTALKASFRNRRSTPDAAVRRGALPPSIAAMNRILETHGLASLLTWHSYDPETQLYHNAGDAIPGIGKDVPYSYGFILEIPCLPGAGQDTAQTLLGMFNHPFVPGTTLQVCLYASPDVSPMLNHWVGARIPGSVYAQMARRRADYLLQGTRQPLFHDTPYVVRNFRVVVAVMMPGQPDGHDETDALSLRDGMMGTLRAAGIPSMVMPPLALLALLDELLNPVAVGEHRQHLPSYDDSQPIRDQVVSRESMLLMDKDGLNNGKTSVRCLSVKDYPKEWALGQMGDLIGDFLQETLQIPCPFMSTVCVQIQDNEETRRNAILKSTRAVQMAESPMAKFVPSLVDRGREWRMVQDSVDKGILLAQVWHGLVIYPPMEMADRAENQVKGLYRARGWSLQTDSFLQVQSFLANLPGRFDPHLAADFTTLKRFRTLTQHNVANTLPIIGEWDGTPTPLLLLTGRRGRVMYIDPFDNTQGNYNGAVVATSGSGKSFLLNEITSSVVGTGGRAWIIDVGRSYERTCKLLGGQFIEFTDASMININPFTHVHEMDTDEMSQLKRVVAQAIESTAEVSDLSMSWIEQAIREVWDAKGNDSTFSDIADVMLADDDQRIRDMGDALFPYTRAGAYGRYFEGPSTLDFSNDLIVLELEELKSKKELQGVVLLILMLRIQQEMYLGERNRRKLCIIDEAWDLMAGGQAGKFIETGYRRVRKYGGAFWTATQSVNDYYKNAAAQAAWDNADWMFFLRQKDESIAQLRQSGRMALDSNLERVLRSIRTRHGEYSEVFVQFPGGSSVGRLIVDKYTAKVYSTRAEEVHAVNQLVARGHSLPDAIAELVRQEEERHGR
jgi:conjugal transfer ATP-binding protein TraC